MSSKQLEGGIHFGSSPGRRPKSSEFKGCSRFDPRWIYLNWACFHRWRVEFLSGPGGHDFSRSSEGQLWNSSVSGSAFFANNLGADSENPNIWVQLLAPKLHACDFKRHIFYRSSFWKYVYFPSLFSHLLSMCYMRFTSKGSDFLYKPAKGKIRTPTTDSAKLEKICSLSNPDQQ